MTECALDYGFYESYRLGTFLNLDLVKKLLTLSALSASEKEQHILFKDLKRIIELVDEMQEIDTDKVEPLRHPVDLPQRLRKDTPNYNIDREAFQKIAPSTENGLYLVPRVVE